MSMRLYDKSTFALNLISSKIRQFILHAIEIAWVLNNRLAQ